MALKLPPFISKIALTLAILVFLCGAGLFYVNKILLPVQAKAMIIKAATQTLKRSVTFDTLGYDPLRGFVITNIVVGQKDDPARVFFQAQSVSAQVVLPALLKKKVIIPSIRVIAPQLFLTRLSQDSWNFNDLLGLAAPAPGQEKPPMDVIIGGFHISEGQLNVEDKSLQDTFTATIGMPVIKASLALNGAVHVAGSLTTPGPFNVDARIDLNKNSGKISLKTDKLLLTPYLRFLPAALPVTLENISLTDTDIYAEMNAKTLSLSGRMNLPGLRITLADGTKANADISLTSARLIVQGEIISAYGDLMLNNCSARTPAASITTNISLPGTRLTMNAGRIETTLNAAFSNLAVRSNGITLNGSPALSLNLIMDPGAETNLTYTGSIDAAGFEIKGLPMVDAINGIKGKIMLATDQAATEELTFTILATPVRLSGKIMHFQAPELDMSATISKADLALIEKFIPGIIKDNGLTIKGTADIAASISGPAAHIPEARINATAVLSAASVESTKLGQSVRAINGTVAYTPSEIAWKDLSAVYLDKTWTSNGTIKDLVSPVISASVKSEGLTAEINAAKKGDAIELISLGGTYLDIPYAVTGKVLLPPGGTPTIDMSGECKLALSSLAALLTPEQARLIEPLKLSGDLEIKADVKGAPQNWQELVSTVSVKTPSVRLMGYQATNLIINARQSSGKIAPLTLSSKIYGGTFTSDAEIDLRKNTFPFTASAKLENTSLELLKKDTPLKQQQLSGLVSASADLNGHVMDMRRMQGTASLKVSNGYLWELEILSKVLGILSSTFKGGDIIITNADADLRIADGKVMTDNLTLRSASVSLVGEGWVDFDQNIDMNISPRVEPKTTEGAVNPLAELNPTAGIINIHISNTLSAPKFEQKISAPQIIKNTLQSTVGSILKLFE